MTSRFSRTASLMVFAAAVPLLAWPAAAYAVEGTTVVVVDTDLSLDDARALALLVASPTVSVRAVVTSDGGSTPCDGARRAEALLAFARHSAIPIGAGSAMAAKPPPWRPVTAALDTALPREPMPCDAIPSALEVAHQAVAESPSPLVWLALGPLTNLAALLRAYPTVAARIARVNYAGGNALAGSEDWNTARDPAAAAAVFASGIPIRTLTPIDPEKALRIDDALLQELADTDTSAARFIARLHADSRVKAHMGRRPAPAVDDMAALALARSSAFSETALPGAPGIRHLEPISADTVRAEWLDIVRSRSPAASRAPESRTDTRAGSL